MIISCLEEKGYSLEEEVQVFDVMPVSYRKNSIKATISKCLLL